MNIGDVVRLKSGGPKMTVESFRSSDKQVICVWFVGEYDKAYSRLFWPDTLQLVVVAK